MAKPRTCVVCVDGYETRFSLPGPGRNVRIDASSFEVEPRSDGAVILRCWEDVANTTTADETVIVLRRASLPLRAMSVVDDVYFTPVVVDGEGAVVVAATRETAIPIFFWDDDELQSTMIENRYAVGCISRLDDGRWVASILSRASDGEVDDFYGSFSKLQRRLARLVNRD